jgi:hypothetical protein
LPRCNDIRGITESYYNQKREEFRTKQKEPQKKMGKLQIADKEYYISSDYILNLASRAAELFESSEPIEKRQLLRFALQNFQLDGTLVRYNEIKPFDKIREYASRQAWLPRVPLLASLAGSPLRFETLTKVLVTRIQKYQSDDWFILHAPRPGLEPGTFSLTANRSAIELSRNIFSY